MTSPAAAAACDAPIYFGGATTPGPADHLATTRAIPNALGLAVSRIDQAVARELQLWDGLGRVGAQRSDEAGAALLRLRAEVAQLERLAQCIGAQLEERSEVYAAELRLD